MQVMQENQGIRGLWGSTDIYFTLQISAYFIYIFVILCEKPLTPFRKCNFSVKKRVFDCLTQIVADFVISGWVGWLAGWTTLGGWAGLAGWVGLGWSGPSRNHKSTGNIKIFHFR